MNFDGKSIDSELAHDILIMDCKRRLFYEGFGALIGGQIKN
jgi:hypothetical protein